MFPKPAPRAAISKKKIDATSDITAGPALAQLSVSFASASTNWANSGKPDLGDASADLGLGSVNQKYTNNTNEQTQSASETHVMAWTATGTLPFCPANAEPY